MTRFKKLTILFALVAAFAASAFAQCTPSLDAFDSAYWLHQPYDVRAFQVRDTTNGHAPKPVGDDPNDRVNLAKQLISRGFVIDVPIMVYGWDPCKVMKLRLDYGYTWVPNAIQPPVSAAPGLKGPGITPYDPNNPPAGAVTVSPDAKDYPPFDPPAPAAPAQGSTPVGANSVGSFYYSLPGDASFPDGYRYTDARGTFVKHVVSSPFGSTHFWEKVN